MVTASMKLEDTCSLVENYDKPRENMKTQRHHSVNKGPLRFLSVVIYGCESCMIQKPEYQRTDAFKLWCWRRLLRILWIAERLNLSILKEISPEYSLGGQLLI